MVSTEDGKPGRPRTRSGGGGRRAFLGQNFLADPNLLEAIVRDAGLAGGEAVLEVGGGEGALTRPLSEVAGFVHVVELDERLREPLEAVAAERGNVALHFGDAMRLDLAALDPAPEAMVSNLPYSIATSLLIRTIAELPGLSRWTVMVQREIADRLRASPGSRVYGAPSVTVQLACSVELVRPVDAAVFRPRPRVASAVVRLDRRGPAPDAGLAALVRAAFAHRRKTLARSVELAGIGLGRDRVAGALGELGLSANARAEALSPEEFRALSEALA